MRIVLLSVFVGSVAWAQSGVPGIDDWNTKALASAVVVLLLVAGWLARALLAEKDARLAQAMQHAEALATARSEGTLLAKQLGDGLSALEDVMQHMTRS